jgi:hypothetical protein
MYYADQTKMGINLFISDMVKYDSTYKSKIKYTVDVCLYNTNNKLFNVHLYFTFAKAKTSRYIDLSLGRYGQFGSGVTFCFMSFSCVGLHT